MFSCASNLMWLSAPAFVHLKGARVTDQATREFGTPLRLHAFQIPFAIRHLCALGQDISDCVAGGAPGPCLLKRIIIKESHCDCADIKRGVALW